MANYQINNEPTAPLEDGATIQVSDNQIIYFKDDNGDLIQPTAAVPKGQDLLVTVDGKVIILEDFLEEPAAGQSPPEIAGFFADGAGLNQDHPILQEAIANEESNGESPAFSLFYTDPSGGISVDVISIDLLGEIAIGEFSGLNGSAFASLLLDLNNPSSFFSAVGFGGLFGFGNGGDTLAGFDDAIFLALGGDEPEPNVIPDIFEGGGDSAEETLRETDAGLSVSGTLSLFDGNAGDTVTISLDGVEVTGSGAGVRDGGASDAAILDMFTISGGIAAGSTTGRVSWEFNSGGEAFDFLADGEQLILTFTVRATDDSGEAGSTDTQEVLITIQGTNDQPEISVTGGNLDFSEIDESDVPLTVEGTLSVEDLDVTDVVTTAVDEVLIEGTGVPSIPATLTEDDILAMVTVDVGQVIRSGQTTGTINWAFDSIAETFDFLAEGETLELTFTISATDDSGAGDEPDSTTQDIKITLLGTNDRPDITVEAGDSDAEGITETDSALTTNGTLSVEDLDLTDVVTTKVDSVAESGTGLSSKPATLTNADLLAMMAVDSAAIIDAASTTGTINWDFDSNGEAFDFLGIGETLVLTYTISATDDSAGIVEPTTDVHDVTITVTGTNDQPDITVAGGDSDAEELTEANSTLKISGTLSVEDVDVSDVITAAVDSVAESGTGLPIKPATLTNADLQSMLSVTTTPIDGSNTTGTIDWDFDSSGEAFEFLAVGETLILTYTISATDSSGAASEPDSDTQIVTITITGTNDAPFITDGGDTADIDETDAKLTANGSLTINDLDTTDTVSVAHTLAVTGTSDRNDNAAPSDSDLLAMFTLSPTAVLDATENTDTTAWAFDSGTEFFDYLAVGETLILTYTITATDSQSETDTDTVTITITGTNDEPVITDGGDTAEIDETDAKLTANGSLTISDVDTTDTVALTQSLAVTGTSDRSDSAAPSDADLAGMFSLTTTAILDSTENTDTTAWSFDSGTEFFDYLAEGETLVLTYTITATDSQSATDTDTVTITITGTNDAPIITDGPDSADLDAASNLSTAGTLTVSDVDTADTVTMSHTLAVSGTGDSSDSAAPTSAELLAMLTLDPTAAISDSENSKGILWQFNSGSEDFAFLGAGQTLILTYTITATDSQSDTDTETVTITVTGTNAAPEISDGPDAASLNETNAALTTSGTLTVSDSNTTDTVSVDRALVVSGSSNRSDAAAPSDSDLLAMLTLSPTAVLDNTETSKAVAWDFNSGSEFFDYLADGETLILTYTVTATDSQTATDTETITITITGTNDAPVITDGPDTANLNETDTTLSATGTLTVSDVDTDDSVQVTSDLVISGTSDRSDPDAPNKATLASMLTWTPGDPVVNSSENSDTVTWTFDSDGEAFDYLAIGETLILTYTVTATDPEFETDTETVTVTITGTNDQPEITVDGGDSAAETLTETNSDLMTSGTLSMADVDRADVVTPDVDQVAVSGSGASSVPGSLTNAALEAMLSVSGSISDSAVDGTISWTFDSDGEAFDFLGEGESLVLTYTVSATDDSGEANDADTQTVVITIEGTNDAPVISDGGDTASLDETNAKLTTTGSLTISDLDTSDTVDVSRTLAVTGSSDRGDAAAPSDAELLAMLTLSPTAVLDDSENTDTTAWTFDSGTEFFDYLADGETLVLTYTVTATDSQNATDTDTVTITITGTNDAPVISDGPDTADLSAAANLTSSGTLTVTDADTTDTVTVSRTLAVSGTADTGDAAAPSSGELLAMLTLDPIAAINGSENSKSIDWSFDSGSEDFAFLGGGQTLILTYTVTATDSESETDTETITLTITGSNSDPILTGGPDSAALDETDAALTASGSFTVSDSNTTDTVDVTRTLAVSGTSNRSDAAAPSDGDLLAMLTLNPTTVLDNTEVTDTFDWNFNSGSEFFDYLAVGETLVLTYTITATDSQSATDTDTVTITITGANDFPVISDGGDTADIDESNAKLTENGLLTIGDADTSDTVDVSRTLAVTGSSDRNDSAAPSDSDLLEMFTLTPIAVLDNSESTDTTAWSFDSGSEFFDYLAEGETLILTYTVTATDSESATDTDTVTITITGTNDAPVISNGGDTENLTETDAKLTANGSLTISDVDTTDTVDVTRTLAVTGSSDRGDSAAPSDSDLLAMFTLSPAAVVDNTENTDTTDWTFDSDSEAFDYLAAGETLILTYTVTATDSESGTDTDTVTVTITGTNDSPVISGGAQNVNAEAALSLLGSFGVFGTVDAQTADFTQISDPTQSFFGLARDTQSGTVFAVTGSELFTIDPDTGVAVKVGDASGDLTSLGASGLAYDINSGTLFLSNPENNGNRGLYTIDPNTAVVTEIGGVERITGLGYDPSTNTLYGANFSDSSLYTLNTSTGAATLVGAFGVGGEMTGLAVDPNSGILYGSNSNGNLYTINVSTGEATLVGDAGLDLRGLTLGAAGSFTAEGDFTVSDVDTTDTVAATRVLTTVAGTSDRSDGAAPSDSALEAMFTLDPAAILDGTENSDTLRWNFNSGVEGFEYLADGETLILTYTITVTDSESATDTETVTITVTGTNDDPVITDGPDTADLNAAANLTSTGSLTVTDADTTDTVAVSRTLAITGTGDTGASGAPTSAELLAMLTLNPTAALDDSENSKAVDWNFNSGAEDFAFLGDGETLILTYTVTATDSESATDTETVTITVTGTSSAPIITGGPDVVGLDETNAALTTAGTITVSDANTSDTVNLTHVLAVAGTSNRSDSAAPSDSELKAMLTLNPTAALDNTETTKDVDWNFNSGSEFFDYLADGETLILTYTVTATDSGSATDTETITVTITGTNDAPTITGLNNTSFNENTVNTSAQLIDTTVTVADSDSANFNSGNLTVTYSAGGGAEDSLGILDSSGVGAITVVGNEVRFSGAAIGDISSDGQNGADLVIDFDSAKATAAAVEALIERLSYANSSNVPTENRTISITINDGDGSTSVAAESVITVNAENDAPSFVGLGVSALTTNQQGTFDEPTGSVRVTLADVQSIAEAAIARWEAAGISNEQLDALRSLTYSVADLDNGHLGEYNDGHIVIDDDGAGGTWFVDTTPDADEEFTPISSSRLEGIAGTPAAQQMDLLTVLLHEQGHELGLGDLSSNPNNLMFALLGNGERRLPTDGQADGAVTGSVDGPVAMGTHDFGDAASTYGDVSHTATGATLGDSRDADTDAASVQNATADGDDLDGVNDDDGVTFSAMTAGEDTEITVNVQGATGGEKVNAWIDWNQDGDFQAGEQVLTDQAVVDGDNTFTVAVDGAALAGNTIARVRLSTDTGLDSDDASSTGGAAASDGEVEDYEVSVVTASAADSIGTLDTVHYIGPIYNPNDNGYAPRLFLSTSESGTATVRVRNAIALTDPTNSAALDYTVTVTNASAARLDLFDPHLDQDNPGTDPEIYSGLTTNANALYVLDDDGPLTVDNIDGLIIESDIPIFANIRMANNSHGASLTAKGQSALGTDFHIGHMFHADRPDGTQSFSYFTVMASEDNTTVDLSDLDPVLFTGDINTTNSSDTVYNIGGALQSFLDNREVVLNRGESFTFAIDAGELNDADRNALLGDRVTSDKPVTVTAGGFTSPLDGSTSGDFGFDQILPVNLLGTEYILLIGKGVGDNEVIERPIIIAVEDNTQILSVNGIAPSTPSLNKGDVLTDFIGSDFQNGTFLLQTSKPVYVYQQTTAGDNRNNSMNFVVPVSDALQPQDISISDPDFLGIETIKVFGVEGTTFSLDGGITMETALGSGDTLVTGSDSVFGENYYVRTLPNQTGDLNLTDANNPVFVNYTTVNGRIGTSGYFSGVPNQVARDDSATTAFETSTTIAVLENDISIGQVLTVTNDTNPTHGTATANPTSGQIEYTPDPGFSGTDVFAYTVKNGDGSILDSAFVTVNVLASTFEFDSSSFAVLEGDSGDTMTMVVTVNRLGDTTGAAAIDVVLAPGAGNSATAGTDFDDATVTVNFKDTEPQATATIIIKGDTNVELDEVISLTLTNPPADTGLGDRSTATLKIIDDESTVDFDFGDLSDAYSVLLSQDGARHVSGGPTLGATVDTEADGTISATASADAGDDGVAFGRITPGQSSEVEVTVANAGSGAKLDAWIDFNGDGEFSSNEQIFDSVAVTNGVNTLSYNTPQTATNGLQGARFRVSTDGDLSSIGRAEDGEVEDYLVNITNPDGTSDAVLSGNASASIGTLDTIHYLPPSWSAATNEGNVRDHYLSLSTLSDSVNVRVRNAIGIDDPTAANALDITIMISKDSPIRLDFTENNFGLDTDTGLNGLGIIADNLNLLAPNESLTIDSFEGLVVEADQPIYANIQHEANAQATSLTSKGQVAQGTEFRIGHIFDGGKEATGSSVFASVIATEDNTVVDFSQLDPALVYFNAGAGAEASFTANGTVTLDRGQSFVIGVDVDLTPNNALLGGLITSDRPIVVNSGSWTTPPDSSTTGRDIGIDQILPVSAAGTEHILVQGEGAAPIEHAILVATEDNTTILSINGILQANPVILEAGEFHQFDEADFSDTSGTLLIETDKPVQVYQTTAGENDASNIGLNFVVPVSDALAPQDILIADVAFLGTPTVNIMGKEGTTFILNGELKTLDNTGNDEIVEGSNSILGENYILRPLTSITSGDIEITDASNPLFVNFVTVSSNATAAGYFSGVPNQIARDDEAIVAFETATEINVLENDIIGGDTYDIVFLTNPANGTVVNNGDGTVTYTPDNGFGGTDSFDYTILKDDGTVSDTGTANVTVLAHVYDFDTATLSVEEGNTATITVNRSGNLAIDSAVEVTFTSGAVPAASSGDVTEGLPHSVVVTFTGGSSTETATLNLIDDGTIEDGENIAINFTDFLEGDGTTVTTTGVGGNTNPSSILTITDPLVATSLSVQDVSIAEGDSGTSVLTFDVDVSAAAGAAFSVEFETVAGSAEDQTGDGDYQSLSGTLNFVGTDANETQQVSVIINGDIEVEPDETFELRLFDVQGPAASVITLPGNATGTITNDDIPPGDTSVEVVGGNLVVTDIDGGDTADDWTFSVAAGNLVITDNNGNLIDLQGGLNGGTGDGTSTVTIALSSFADGLSINSLAGDDKITFDSTFDIGSGKDLTISGGDDTDSVVWESTSQFGSLDFTGEEFNSLSGVIDTGTGNQTYNGALNVGGDTVITGGDVTFNGIVNSGATGSGGPGAVAITDQLVLSFDAGLDNTTTIGVWENNEDEEDHNLTLGAAVKLESTPTTSISGITASYEFPTAGGSNADDFAKSSSPTSTLPGNPSDNNVTFEIWFKPGDLSNNTDQVLFETGGNGSGFSFYIVGGDTLRVTMMSDSATAGFVIETPLTGLDGEFIQAVAVANIEGDQSVDSLSVFINGTEVTGSPQSPTGGDVTKWTGGGTFSIGGAEGNVGGTGFQGVDLDSNSFDGEIAIVRLYDRILTSSEIGENFGAVLGQSDLTVNTSGETIFNAVVGGTNALSGLDVNSTGTDVDVNAAVNVASGGVSIDSPTAITIDDAINSAGGDVTLNADSDDTDDGGVEVSAAISAAGGNIDLSGSITTSGSTLNTGVFVGDVVSTTGTGTITIAGDGAGTTGRGVQIGDGNSVVQVSTVDGDISITGTSDPDEVGVNIFEADVISTGSGKITIDGNGGDGVLLNGDSASPNVVQSTSGDIAITGVGTMVSGVTLGLDMSISSAGGGNISLDGTSSQPGTSGLSLIGGAISTTTGDITLTGDGALNDADIFLTTIGSTSGDITFVADTFSNLAGTITSSGDLLFDPRSAGTTIGIGGGAGTLTIEDSEIALLTDGFNSITIGDATAGDVSIDTVTFTDNLTIVSGGTISDTTGTDIVATSVTLQGDLEIGGDGTVGSLDITGSTTINSGSDVDFEFSSAGNDKIVLARAGDKVILVGSGNATFTDLGSAEILAGSTITLIDNAGTDSMSSEFANLGDGDTISDFLGSGLTVTADYQGGTGNDLTLTVQDVEVSIAATDNSAGEPDNDGEFTVSLATGVAPTGGITVNFSVDGSATQGGDYTLKDSGGSTITNSVFIAAGESSATIAIDMIDDSTVEGAEDVEITVTGTNVSGYVAAGGGSDVSTINLSDDDSAAVTVENITENEGDTLTFTVTLDKAVVGGTDVTVSLSNGTATSGTDFGSPSLTALNFTGNAGETKTFTVQATEDALVEGNENFTVNLSATNGVDDADSAVGTITNDDSATVSISDATIGEGGTLLFDITMTEKSDENVVLTFSTSNGTATTGDSDYTAKVNQTVTILAGSTTAQISIATDADAKVEVDETITLELTNIDANGRSITIDDDTATGTITNDDQATLSIAGVSVAESDSGETATLTFTVSVDNAVDGGFSVDFGTAEGTAEDASGNNDFTATSGTLTFAGNAGETKSFDVTVNGDNVIEANETMTAILSNISAGGKNVVFAGGGSTLSATGTINNDDFDNSNPEVTSFERQAPLTEVTNSDTLVFEATFNEAVTGVGDTDFVVSGGSTATVTNVQQISTTIYNITVSGGDLASFNGTVGIDLAAGATIIDSATNNVTISEPSTDQTYTLDNAPPAKPSAPDMTAATDTGQSDLDDVTSDDTPTFTGTADAGSEIKIYIDGVEVATTTATGGTWTHTAAALANGTHTIHVTAADALGNVSVVSDSLDFVVDDTGAVDNATVTFSEGGDAVQLDDDVTIFDPELSSADNFANATLTLTRDGGANGDDVFSNTATLGTLTQGQTFTANGTTIGTVTTNSGGTLKLTFNSAATAALVNAAIQGIAYANESANPPTSVTIDYTFGDGNTGGQGTGGELTALGSVTVAIFGDDNALTAADGIGDGLDASDFGLMSENLDEIATAAKEAWIESGRLSESQIDMLDQATFRVEDLGDDRLAYANGNEIVVDDDAAGHGWFIDETPEDDAEFNADGDAVAPEAVNRMDLLTTIEHELGHVAGLGDRFDLDAADDIMFGELGLGERRGAELESELGLNLQLEDNPLEPATSVATPASSTPGVSLSDSEVGAELASVIETEAPVEFALEGDDAPNAGTETSNPTAQNLGASLNPDVISEGDGDDDSATPVSAPPVPEPAPLPEV